MNEKTPITKRWKQVPTPASIEWVDGVHVPSSAWRHDLGLRVLSSLEQVELPGSDGLVGPTWHISISVAGRRRPTDAQALLGLRAFQMVGAEEDNHHPGVARHYFLPQDPQYRGVCECKVTEKTITDEDGYAWTTPHAEGDCRGCEYAALTGKPCPLHPHSEQSSVLTPRTTS